MTLAGTCLQSLLQTQNAAQRGKAIGPSSQGQSEVVGLVLKAGFLPKTLNVKGD